MKSTTASSAVYSNQREAYIHTRDDPFFSGMRRGEVEIVKKSSAIDPQGKLAKRNSYGSALDIGDQGSRNIKITVTEEASHSPKNSLSDIVLEPIGRSLSGRWSKTSSPLVVIHPDMNINFQNLNEPSVSSPDSKEGKEELASQGGPMKPAIQTSYHVSKKQTNISNVPLPPSAAFFYHGPSQQMEVTESCESVYKLNMYLKARRADVNAGVPGRYLHAVIGAEVSDVGSVASTIMYAFYLDETCKSKQFYTVPVINIARADLDSHAEVQWLHNSCHIDLSSLVFIDELAGILMDTENLSNSDCTSKDKYTATLLINGAGHLDSMDFTKYVNQTYQLKIVSSIGMSIAQLLSHDSASIQEITHFQRSEKLGLLLVVSGYYDSQNKFKREIPISAESVELMKNLLQFLNSSVTQLPLKVLHQSGT